MNQKEAIIIKDILFEIEQNRGDAEMIQSYTNKIIKDLLFEIEQNLGDAERIQSCTNKIKKILPREEEEGEE